MKILDFKVYNGRNIYTHRSCIKINLDLEGLYDTPSKDIPYFNERLVEMLPELKEHHCGIDEEGGFCKRLQEGTYLAHICEHITIALQNKVGLDVRYGKAREVDRNLYYIIYEIIYKNTGIEAGNIAVDIINSLLKNNHFNILSRMNKLKDILIKEQLGQSSSAIYNEAKKRGIPIIRLGEGSVLQFGYGKYAKRIEATIGSETKAVGVDIASDKLLTKELLEHQCLPVPEGDKVYNEIDLILKASKLGYPLVMKPQFGNQGKGVIINIKNDLELMKAYSTLTSEYNYKDIIIEKYIKGRDYRVLVVGKKIAAAAERMPPFIIGDGENTIRTLIQNINASPLRGEGHENVLTKIKIDKEILKFLAMERYMLDSVIPFGKKIFLRENANLSTGGTAADCTEEICKENAEICIRAAEALKLDICGIDLRCKDIKEPMDKYGAIIEVNAAPGIRMHHFPAEGDSRNVASIIVDEIYKNGYKQIPIISVTGTNGKTTTTRLIEHTLSQIGLCVGMTTTGGIFINNKCIKKGDTTGPKSALAVLLNDNVEAAVLETARGGIIREGLAYDLADVGVITNITSDHLGIDGIETMEDLAHVKSLVVEAVKKDGYAVINADDKYSISLLERIKCNIIFFSKDKNNTYIQDNIRNKKMAVYQYGEWIYAAKDGEEYPLVKVNDIGISLGGILMYNVDNAICAAAALMGIDLKLNQIKQGLCSFFCTEEQNPGRFNIYNFNDITLVLDYGHNIEGYRAVINALNIMKYTRLTGIIGVPGDRTDENIYALGNISGNNFNHIYIKEDFDKRGRKTGEVATLLEEGVLSSGFKKKNLNIVLDEKQALLRALKNSIQGEVIIIFYENYEPLVNIIKNYMTESKMQSHKQSLA